MAAEFAHDTAAVAFGAALDDVADVAEPRARADPGDSAPHAFVGDVAQAPRLHRWLAYAKHAARIAVVAVFDHRDVDVEYVARLEFFVAGHAMTYDVIDRRADRFRIGLIARRRVIERRGNRFLFVDHVIVAQPVDLVRGHAGLDERRDEIEHFRREPAGDAHFRDFVAVLGYGIQHGGGTVHGIYAIKSKGARILVENPAGSNPPRATLAPVRAIHRNRTANRLRKRCE